MSIKHKFKYGIAIFAIVTGTVLLINSMEAAGSAAHETKNSITVIKTEENVIRRTESVIKTVEIVYSPRKIEFVPVNVPMEEAQQKEVFQICQQYGISYTLVIAIIEHESQFDAEARSATGDTGLMQINDCNKAVLSDLGFTNLTDPIQNVEAGIYILSTLAKKYEVSEALMAYNMGEKNARKLWDQGIYESEYSQEITNREIELSQYIDDLVMQGE